MDLSTLSLSQTDLKIMNQTVEKVVKVEMVTKEVKEVKMVVQPEEKVVLLLELEPLPLPLPLPQMLENSQHLLSQKA